MDHQTTKLEDDTKAMPPPPPPRAVLLEPEIESLRRCLQNAVLKTGQIYAFYGDTRRLEIAKYTSSPPQALTSALGRELEKYDQLCDTIESHLLRAIAILQRDLQREERKQEAIRLEQEALKSKALKETQTAEEFPEPAAPSSVEFIPTNPRNSPTLTGAGSMNLRRPSAISISSLQRPSIPLKLDLPSSSMRISTEEGSSIYPNGPPSPVTLAPKSARPMGANEYPHEFIATFTNPVDPSVIDLTILPENNDHNRMKPNIDPAVGSSSDKPIELDLDMSEVDMSMNDLFGDNEEPSAGPSGVGNMFGATNAAKPAKDSDLIDLTTQDIFASLSNNPIPPAGNIQMSDSSAPAEAPSPATLLAAGFSQRLSPSNPLGSDTGLSGSDQPFDMTSVGDFGDLGAFNPGSDFTIQDMETFLSMGANPAGGGNSGSPGKIAGPME